MYNRMIFIVLSILLLLVFISRFTNHQDIRVSNIEKQNQVNGIQKVYILQGKNQNWSLDNYKIVLGFNSIKTGWGRVHIINKSNIDINALTFYEVTIVKIDKENEEKSSTLITKSASVNAGGMAPEDNLNTGEISNEGKPDLSRYNLEEKYDIYAIIKYSIKNGEVKEEKFKLDIVTSISESNKDVKVVENKT